MIMGDNPDTAIANVLFARAQPEDKLRIVKTLKEADIGIAMGKKGPMLPANPLHWS